MPPATSPYFLPTELESMMNNSGEQGRGGLVHPVSAGHGGK